MNEPTEEREKAKTEDCDLAHRTTAFQLACVAAPFAVTMKDDTKALLRAKRLLILADTRLNIWRNPAPRGGFTADEALKEINKRAKDFPKLRHWKSIRPLREHLKEVVAETTNEDFGELWKLVNPTAKREACREIDHFLIGKIMDRRRILEDAKQKKAVAARTERAAKRKRKGP